MDQENARPPTPQATVHRMPDKPEDPSTEPNRKPDKFIIIMAASTAVAGKLQLAKTVSAALACPLFQSDSLHESAAKAARVGADSMGGANKGRYQRMWLSKMTRTGLLFPEESRAAGAGFSGFGGSSSTSSSRRGSASSVASDNCSSDAASLASSVLPSGAPKYINGPPAATLSQTEGQRKSNPALLMLTHPRLEAWQKSCIKRAVGEYSIGAIFVPLDHEDLEDDQEGEDLPVLRPLDPRTMTRFGSLINLGVRTQRRNWAEEIVVKVDVNAVVNDLAGEIVEKVREVMKE
ncbi:hypothetical protein EJ03DRAFT_38004 [Teratosphaeria nubilosa]|uniref:Uncharacterized protein n=1 Tax=Teratosphaeria nubilosa TaxID=161662 RepID=A0A6G1LEB5_9PEZI|nr:hypothetical protein EJ03DRAFT_38004 [Teratosphaeria nubilosa]